MVVSSSTRDLKRILSVVQGRVVIQSTLRTSSKNPANNSKVLYLFMSQCKLINNSFLLFIKLASAVASTAKWKPSVAFHMQSKIAFH